MKFDIISVSVSAQILTGLIIPHSFTNTEQSFQSHPKTHVQGSHIAVSFVCFQTRKLLEDLELKYDKNKYSVNMNKE